MRGKLILLLGFFAFSGCLILQGQTNTAPGILITNFADGAQLSESQVQTVLQLAVRAGVTQPHEVATFIYKPLGGIGISIHGAEHEEGRKISYEEVVISTNKPFRIEQKELRLGDFWVNPPYVKTNHLLTAKINGKTKRIYLYPDIPTDTADKIIDGVSAGLDKYVSDNKEIVLFTAGRNPPNISDLESLAYHAETNEYELRLSYENGWRGYHIRCKLENGRVVILSISSYVV